MIFLQGKYNIAQIFLDEIDNATTKQIINMLNQKAFVNSQIRFMPDCHVGKSSVVGTTMTLNDFVIPSVLGSDIGCGVLVVQLKEDRIDLPKFNSVVNNYINTKESFKNTNYKNLKCLKQVGIKEELVYSNLGTLGGGNHFISLEKDDNIYLIIHTGSRLLGNIVNDYYKQKAYELCNREVPFEFSYLEKDTEAYYDYLHDLKIVSDYAILNRNTIKKLILKYTKLHAVDEFDCMHNYIDKDNILRKGAISCKQDERVIIPLNMADGSLLGIGKGNEDWNCSGPHGAGRKYSRKDAKNIISMTEYKQSMENIFSTSVSVNTIDEAPQAYKDKDLIINSIKDTVEIINKLTPIYNFKHSSK